MSEPATAAASGPQTDEAARLLQQAIAAGLLPPGAQDPRQTGRPWPVVLLTGLGAWLVALPLLAVIGLLLGDLISRDLGPYLVGVLVLAIALVVLRARDLPLFVEQLAVPLLLVGGGALGFGLFRDLPVPAASALLALLAAGLALVVPQAWLQALLGAAAAVMAGGAGSDFDLGLLNPREGGWRLWMVLQGLLAAWLVMLAALHTLEARAGTGPRELPGALDALAGGWIAVVLLGLAGWAGMSFLVGAVVGTGEPGALAQALAVQRARGVTDLVPAAVSALLAALAAAGLARTWPPLRAWPLAGVALVAIAGAALMPTLGGALLVLALALTGARPLVATAAALSAVWIVGAFYYQLTWPLAWKAIGLVVAGALLAGVARGLHARTLQPARHEAASRSATVPARHEGLARAAIALGAVATVLVLQLGQREKEALLARGRPVYVELTPVDPRSLMQGDYMRIAFRLPEGGVPTDTPRPGLGLVAPRPRAAGTVDARGVLTLQRVLAPAEPAAAGETAIELTPKDGDWVLVTDGWFFAEGDATLWAAARYGEFRLDGAGRALLVGMADAQLGPIGR